MVHSRSPSQLTPDASPCAFSATLTTTTLDRSSLRWFGTSPCRAVPEGPPPSPTRHRNSQRDLLHRNLQSRSWHTIVGVAFECHARELPDQEHVERVVQHQVRQHRRNDSSNAVGNFCFEVSLCYRRVERPRRV